MPKKIVVIDDDPDIVQIVKTTLKSKGYEVTSAPDGEDGLRLVYSTQPDLVILDLMMPRISGLEVCRRLRQDEQTKNIPIIVISGIGEKTGKPEEFWRVGLGAEDFISKPFDPLALLGRVEAVLRSNQYVSTRNNGGNNGPNHENGARVPQPPLSEAAPREVVRRFVEAWNGTNFAEEWECLGETMRGPIEKKEYILRRQQAYAEEGPSPHRQKVASVLAEEIEGDTARVLIEREESNGRRSTRRREQYTLTKTAEGWKIASVRVLGK